MIIDGAGSLSIQVFFAKSTSSGVRVKYVVRSKPRGDFFADIDILEDRVGFFNQVVDLSKLDTLIDEIVQKLIQGGNYKLIRNGDSFQIISIE